MKLYLFYRFTWNYKNRVWKNEVKDIFTVNSIAHVNVGKLLVDQLLVLLVTNQVNNKKAERAEMEKKATGHRWCKETNIYLVDLLSETSSCHIDRERWTLLYKEARLCCFDFFMLTDVPSATSWVQHLTTLEGIMLQWLQGQGEFFYGGQVFFPRLNQTFGIP